MICPNYKNKEVFDGFNEIIEALGGKPMTEEEFRSSELRNQRTGLDYSAMEATYKMYHANNGNLLDLAPNGKTSILFLTLLSEFNGDRAKAIKAKSAVYSDSFRKWFGDWIGTVSPKVKFYGATMGKTTASKLNTNLVDFDDIIRDDIKKLAKELSKTVRQLKMESGPEYVSLLKNAIKTWRNDTSNNGKTLVVSNAALAKESIFDNVPALPSKEEFIKRQVNRGEGNPSDAELYYDDLVNKWMPENFITDNRFVSDIEGVSKVIDENGEPLIGNIEIEKPGTGFSTTNDDIMYHKRNKNVPYKHSVLINYYTDTVLQNKISLFISYTQVAKKLAESYNKQGNRFFDNFYADTEDYKISQVLDEKQKIQKTFSNYGIPDDAYSIKDTRFPDGSIKVNIVVYDDVDLFIDDSVDQITEYVENLSEEEINSRIRVLQQEYAIGKSGDDILYFINPKNREEIELRIKKNLEKASLFYEDVVKDGLDYLNELQETAENLVFIRTAIRWFKFCALSRNQLEDLKPIFEAARKKSIDIQQFKTPKDLLEWYGKSKNIKEAKGVDASKYEGLIFNREEILESGEKVLIYDVRNDEVGQLSVCQILYDTNPTVGDKKINFSPWCLSTFNINDDKATPTHSAKHFWETYNAGKRQIAMLNGYPIAFNSSDQNKDGWWDYRDRTEYNTIQEINVKSRSANLNDATSLTSQALYRFGNYTYSFLRNYQGLSFDDYHLGIRIDNEQLMLFSKYYNFEKMFSTDYSKFNFMASLLNLLKIGRAQETLFFDLLNQYINNTVHKEIRENLKELNEIITDPDIFKYVENVQRVIDQINNINEETIKTLVGLYDISHLFDLKLKLDEECENLISNIRLYFDTNEKAIKYTKRLEEEKKKLELKKARKLNAQQRERRPLILNYGGLPVESDFNWDEYEQQNLNNEYDIEGEIDRAIADAYEQTELPALYNKWLSKPINSHLESHLRKILKKFRFEIIDSNTIYDVFGNDVLGAADFLLKLVYLAESEGRDAITFPEEFAHSFIKLMGSAYHRVENRERWPETKTYSQLRDLIEKTDFYKLVYDEYSSTYLFENHKPNTVAIKEEALGKALAAVLTEKAENFKEPSLFLKIKKWFNDFLNRFKSKIQEVEQSENINLMDELNKIADSILDNTYFEKYLKKIDDKGYKKVSYEKTIELAKKADGGKGYNIARFICEIGGILSGSISYRLQGATYRKSTEALHDLDFAFSPDYFVGTYSFYQTQEEILNNVLNEPIILRIKQQYSDFNVIGAFYSDNKVIVNAMICEDNSLYERFCNMSGNFNSRMEHFTEEERKKMYLIDIFFNPNSDSYKNAIKDEKNGLLLTYFTVPFKEKLKFGRAKDIYDYQRFKPYRRIYRDEYILNGVRRNSNPDILFYKKNTNVSIDNGESICDCSSASTITGSTQIKQSLQNLNKQDNNFARSSLIKHYIDKSRDEYVQQQVDQYVSFMHDPSTFDIYGIKIGSAIDWDEQKIKQIIGEQQEKLAKVYGLKKQKKEDGTFIYTSKDKSKNSRLRVAFVNSMTGLDWTDDEGKVHKGLFVEKSKFEEAAWNAIYLSITDGDATTFVHEMIHYYIRTFWDSLVVQDALREVDDNKNVVRTDSEEDRKYSKTLEEKLVNTISESTMWNKNRSLIDKFHDGINNIIKNIIGAPIKQDKNVQANIIDTLNAAFSINQDLSDRKAETIYYYKYAGSVPQSQISPIADQPTEIEGTTFYKIKLTIESRLKSEKSRGKAPGDELEKFIQKLQRRSAFNKENVYDTIVDFLLLATSDVRKAKDALVQLRSYSKELLENLDVEEFMHFRYDIISYYDKMVYDVLNDYLNNNSNIQPEDRKLFEKSLSDIKSTINGLKSDFNEILDKYIDIKIEQYGNELVAVGDKDTFIANMKLWVGNQINDGNLMPLENIIGTAVTSYSPIVRLVEYIVTAQNRITYTNALTKGHELIDKYKKCASIGKKLLSINFVKQFCELDDDGNPTGYFTRKYNYGKLYKQRDDLKRKLVKKHNIQVDKETGEILFKNKDLYVKYMTDFYNELDKFANLKYKKDYYIQRAKILSPKTIELQSLIQKQIDIILRKATDKELGIPFLFNLNKDERDQLDQLNREMLNLSNPYIITYRQDGSIETFEEKAGDMLQVAKELMLWNAYKAGKLKYKSNYEKFNAAREKIKQRFGENSNEDKQFVRKYRVRRITSEFYDLLGMLKSDNQELVELYQRRSAIRNSIMPRRGYILPNLKKLNNQAFAELKRIDERISELLTFNDNNFNEIANKAWVGEYVDGRLTSNPVFNYFQEIEQRLRLSGQIPFDQVSDYMYTNSNGNLKPLSIFKYTLPISESFLEYSLLGEFSELDPTSELLNDKWDVEQKEELQPKNWKEYENKAFAKIYEKGNEALKDFYEAIISTMREAYSMLPNMDVDKMLYVMPQMRDRDAKLLFRNRHVLTNMGASVADAFSITERDTQYNEDFVQRPDGSSVETIPIRWITKLRDPSIISTDIVQTVTMFYEMANNYRNKVEINPLLLAILFKTQGGFGEQAPGTSFSQQSERIKTYLQMYVYGRTRTGMHSDRPMSDKEIRGFRIAETLLSVAHRKLMSHNWRAVLKNLIDSMLTDLAEIYTGKYIDSECALLGVKAMGAEIFSQFSSFGRANNKSKIAALMLLNGCSGTISEIFGQHNETWLRRIISKHASMGEYDLVDYTVKGHYVASLYHSIRLVKNQNTKELEFMTKDQAAYHYLAAGLGMNDGIKEWKKSKSYLFDAYTVDDKGNAVVIDEYKKHVYPYVKSLGRSTNRLVNQVAGTIRERTSVINGILDSANLTRANQLAIGGAVLLMRGWMITQGWDNLKDGHDFAEYKTQWEIMLQLTKDDKYAGLYMPGYRKSKKTIDLTKYIISSEDPEFRGQYNFETGSIETGQWRGLKNASVHYIQDFLSSMCTAYKHIRRVENSTEYKNKLTMNERYKLRRLSATIASFIVMSALIWFTMMLTIKYPEKWFLDLLCATNISVISERASQLPVVSLFAILDIINSIIISKSLIEDVDKLIDLVGDIIEVAKSRITDNDDTKYNEEIKTGAYAGRQKWERDLIKATSYTRFNIDNVFRSMTESGNKASINYYIHNVSPTKQVYESSMFFVPALLESLGVDVQEPEWTKQTKKSKSKKSIAF